MLNCEKCNYVKKLSGKESKIAHFSCELTGFLFKKDFEDYDLDNHPCFNYNHQETELDTDRIAS